jgi:hypothetical protein
VIVEALRLLNMLLSMLGNLREPLLNMVIQPLLTVAILLCLYVGWHIRDEGNLAKGLRVAFVDTRANREAEQQQLVAALMQAELHQYATSGKLIDELLGVALLHSMGAARIRLGVVHNGITGLTGTSMLRYDVTNAVAAAGRAAGGTVINEPLSTWSELLPALLAGRCQLILMPEVRNFELQARLQTLGASSLLSCPVTDVQGKLLGALFLNWDAGDQPPAGEQMKQVMDFDQRIGGQIASVLSVRSSLGLPLSVVRR